MYQMSPEIIWENIEIDHVKSFSSFVISKNGELLEAYDWVNTESVKKEVHQQKVEKVISYIIDCISSESIDSVSYKKKVENKIFINELYSSPSGKNGPTNEIKYNHIDQI